MTGTPLAVATVAACLSFTSFAAPVPHASGDTAAGECRDSMTLANAAFFSASPYLYAPPKPPNGLRSRLILSPRFLDISGGDDLDAADDTFDKNPKPQGELRSFYRQRESSNGHRVVVEETSRGWRGDEYALYVLPETLSHDDFLGASRSPVQAPLLRPTAGGWRPPLVLRNQDGSVWFIDIAASRPLDAWTVYRVTGSGAVRVCEVRFLRKQPSDISQLLPDAVQRLHRLLDGTLGSGEDEGTLRPTARIRENVQDAFANAVARPWAMRTPYNTRGRVDARLGVWGCLSSTNAKRLRLIHAEYRRARVALASYYRGAFEQSRSESAQTADHVLDILFRTYFVFRQSPEWDESEPLPCMARHAIGAPLR